MSNTITNTHPYHYIVVDCHNLAYRMWWNVHELTDSTGLTTGLEYGFCKGVLALARIWQPAILVLVWDGYSQRCSTLFPKITDPATGVESGYKSQRQRHETKDTEPAWGPRLQRLRRVFTELVSTIYHPELEADEEIARFVSHVQKLNKKSLIISKDNDLWQLVNDFVHVTSEPEVADVIDATKVQEKWGVTPAQLVLRRALEGDSSDRIPGVPRLLKKWIIDICAHSENFDDLMQKIYEDAYPCSEKQREKILSHLDVIERNYQLMDLSAQFEQPVHILPGTTGSAHAALQLCQELEFVSLTDRREWNLLESITRNVLGLNHSHENQHSTEAISC